VSRDFGEKRLTGAGFLEVAKGFDTLCFDGLLYKLTGLNFPSYLVKTISSYLNSRTYEASFHTATSTCLPNPWPVQLFGKPIQWVDTARYLGVTLDTRLNWSNHIDQVRKKAA